ncbi:MAG: Sua5 family C-terminal domain-containing protein, partial [Candidatus Woesearchaeota archaeon]
IESTVVDLSGGVPRVLRPGKVTREQLEAVVGEVRQYEQAVGDKPRSPGMKYKHYSPDARIIVVKDRAAVERVLKDHPGEKVKVLDYEGEADMARNLFRDFRLADKEGYGLIVVREVSEDGFGYALMDKLRKASGG